MIATQGRWQDAIVDEKIFPVRLRQLRIAAGLNQAELAELSGLKQGHISELESGTRKAPSWGTVLRLARALGVTCEAFCAESPDDTRPPSPPRGRPPARPAPAKRPRPKE